MHTHKYTYIEKIDLHFYIYIYIHMYAGMPVHIYMGGCQNYGPFWVPITIRHLLFQHSQLGKAGEDPSTEAIKHIGYSKHHWPRIFLDITREGENETGHRNTSYYLLEILSQPGVGIQGNIFLVICSSFSHRSASSFPSLWPRPHHHYFFIFSSFFLRF